MNDDITWETMKKIAWGALVVLITIAAFVFFWKAKNSGRFVNTDPEKGKVSQETEEEKLKKMYALMQEGYVSTLTGEIKSVDLEKGKMEIESNQSGELKTVQVSFGPKTEFIKIVYSMGDVEAAKNKPYDEAIEGSQETSQVDKSVLVPGIFVDVEAAEMFQPEKADSIKAVKISLSQTESSN